jgi:S-adenosylmethionine decarboxylase
MPIPDSSRRYHIILDAYNCQPKQLSDKKKIDKVIRDITKLCGMTLLHGPVVLEGVPENPGVTGFAIIDFSHISIHTFTKDKELCVDIFSCKPFSYHKVKKYVKESFNLDNECIRYVEVKYQPEEKDKQTFNYPYSVNS